MDALQQITVNNKIYFLANDIIKASPVYSKGYRNASELVNGKNITAFIYARLVDNQWIKSDGTSKKFDKILIRKKFAKNIPELNGSDIQDIKDDNGVSKAPDIIYLDDNEKFKDDDGNILNIETRGTRHKDNIFFKVKDVSESFEILNLYQVITNTERTYIKNTHYQYFICTYTKNNTTKTEKNIFLTFDGMRKVIDTSRSLGIDLHTKNILTKWLYQIFDKTTALNFKFKVHNISNMNKGLVYCVTSKLINYVKIGFWRVSLDTLYSRYITYFGPDLDLFYVYTFHPNILESKCHKHFNDKNLSNELFKKEYLDDYILFLNNNVIDDYDYGSDNLKKSYLTAECDFHHNSIQEFDNNELINEINKLININNLLIKDIELKNKDIELRDKDIEILKLQLKNNK